MSINNYQEEGWNKFCQAKNSFMLALDMEIMKCRLDEAGLKVVEKSKKELNGSPSTSQGEKNEQRNRNDDLPKGTMLYDDLKQQNNFISNSKYDDDLGYFK